MTDSKQIPSKEDVEVLQKSYEAIEDRVKQLLTAAKKECLLFYSWTESVTVEDGEIIAVYEYNWGDTGERKECVIKPEEIYSEDGVELFVNRLRQEKEERHRILKEEAAARAEASKKEAEEANYKLYLRLKEIYE